MRDQFCDGTESGFPTVNFPVRGFVWKQCTVDDEARNPRTNGGTDRQQPPTERELVASEGDHRVIQREAKRGMESAVKRSNRKNPGGLDQQNKNLGKKAGIERIWQWFVLVNRPRC
jgi:hypothetical protein